MNESWADLCNQFINATIWGAWVGVTSITTYYADHQVVTGRGIGLALSAFAIAFLGKMVVYRKIK